MATKSPKTTKWGIVGFIGVLLMCAGAAMDGDPETLVDTQALMTAMGGLVTAVSVLLQGKASKDED